MTKKVALWGRDDLNDGTAPNQAFRSIQAGLNAASNGEEVEIYTGKYTEALFYGQGTVNLAGKGQTLIYPPLPQSIFLELSSTVVHLKNLQLIDFTKTLKLFNGSGSRSANLRDCQIISTNQGLIESNSTTEALQIFFNSNGCLFVNQDFTVIDVDSIEYSTYHNCHLQFRYNNFGNGYIQDSIMTASHCDFTDQVILMRNILFGSNTIFTYNDGTNSVSGVDFATFQAANQTYGWGFGLSNCQVADETAIYVAIWRGNFSIQASCVGVGMSTNGGVVGAFKVGSQVLATDSGWQNNAGFTLNGNQYEASTAAAVESPIIDFGMNKPIYRIETNQGDGFEDGRLFNHLGHLAAPILSGGSQTGLALDLVEGSIYCVDGFIEVETNLRSFTFTSQQCFTALASEQIREVTASGVGEISEVIYLDGHARLLARWWKEGESEPINWNVVTRDQPVLVDANGKANGELDYDQNAFPRHPVARYLRVKAELSTNNLKS